MTVVIGHIVISLPYTLLVLIPRLQQIDVGLEEAAYDLGATKLLWTQAAEVTTRLKRRISSRPCAR